jgi:hypothetical protein
MNGFIERLMARSGEKIPVLQVRPMSRFERYPVTDIFTETSEEHSVSPISGSSIQPSSQMIQEPAHTITQIVTGNTVIKKPHMTVVQEFQSPAAVSQAKVADTIENKKVEKMPVHTEPISSLVKKIGEQPPTVIHAITKEIHMPSAPEQIRSHTVNRVIEKQVGMQMSPEIPLSINTPTEKIIEQHVSTESHTVHEKNEVNHEKDIVCTVKQSTSAKNSRQASPFSRSQIPGAPVVNKPRLGSREKLSEAVPSVNIHIGSVEIHATKPARKNSTVQSSPRQPVLSLNEYLAQKSGGLQ